MELCFRLHHTSSRTCYNALLGDSIDHYAKSWSDFARQVSAKHHTAVKQLVRVKLAVVIGEVPNLYFHWCTKLASLRFPLFVVFASISISMDRELRCLAHSMEISFNCNSISGFGWTMHFCTCYDSTNVVLYAKLYSKGAKLGRPTGLLLVIASCRTPNLNSYEKKMINDLGFW